MVGKFGWIGTALLIFTSFSSAADDGFLPKKTLEALDAYCPDGSFIVRSALTLVGTALDQDFVHLIDGNDERACLTSLNTIVHEDNHTINTYIGREALKKKIR